MDSQVEVIEYEVQIEIYFKEQLITNHSYNVPKISKKITKNKY